MKKRRTLIVRKDDGPYDAGDPIATLNKNGICIRHVGRIRHHGRSTPAPSVVYRRGDMNVICHLLAGAFVPRRDNVARRQLRDRRRVQIVPARHIDGSWPCLSISGRNTRRAMGHKHPSQQDA